MTNSKIIFTGHFDIGEKLNDSARTLVQRAAHLPDKKIILIGDIGVEDKLNAFVRKGLEGIVLTYHLRHHCAETECVLAQLPKTEKEIIETIDLNQYEQMVDIMKNKYPDILSGLKKNEPTALSEFKKIRNDFLVNQLIQDRVQLYGLNAEETILVKEKSLRNRVGRRVKKGSGKSWSQFSGFVKDENGVKLNDEIIVNANQKPVCRGIIFALHELVAEKGFTEIDYFIEERHRSLIEKGWQLFDLCNQQKGNSKSGLTQVNFITDKEQILK